MPQHRGSAYPTTTPKTTTPIFFFLRWLSSSKKVATRVLTYTPPPLPLPLAPATGLRQSSLILPLTDTRAASPPLSSAYHVSAHRYEGAPRRTPQAWKFLRPPSACLSCRRKLTSHVVVRPWQGRLCAIYKRAGQQQVFHHGAHATAGMRIEANLVFESRPHATLGWKSAWQRLNAVRYPSTQVS